MLTDVVDLRDFYDTGLGHVAARMIRRRVRRHWPDLRGLRVVGVGYATPYLGVFRAEAERVFAIMPAAQGVLHWPREGRNLVALSDETDLPLPDNAVDRVLLVHALESTEHLRPMLRELWRVLADNGRLLAVVPNRRGIWARSDRTPFGHGHPYSLSQLSRLLRDNMFTPMESDAALYVPPTRSRVIAGAAPAWEKIGRRWLHAVGGVVMVEAGKQLYAAGAVKTEPRRRPVLVGIPKGAARTRSPHASARLSAGGEGKAPVR